MFVIVKNKKKTSFTAYLKEKNKNFLYIITVVCFIVYVLKVRAFNACLYSPHTQVVEDVLQANFMQAKQVSCLQQRAEKIRTVKWSYYNKQLLVCRIPRCPSGLGHEQMRLRAKGAPPAHASIPPKPSSSSFCLILLP